MTRKMAGAVEPDVPHPRLTGVVSKPYRNPPPLRYEFTPKPPGGLKRERKTSQTGKYLPNLTAPFPFGFITASIIYYVINRLHLISSLE